VGDVEDLGMLQTSSNFRPPEAWYGGHWRREMRDMEMGIFLTIDDDRCNVYQYPTKKGDDR